MKTSTRTPLSNAIGSLSLIAAAFISVALLPSTLRAAGLISVTSPPYCSEIKGDTNVVIAAPGYQQVTVKCWKQGTSDDAKDFGSDSLVGEVKLDGQGNGSITFPADQYPHGPVTVRIMGENGKDKDNCYLQLYNKGGVSWKEGIPAFAPPAAEDMQLVFQDDFKKPLSISSTDPKATYYDHKPPNGATDFSSLRFTGFDAPNNPFLKVDNYLRIRASEKEHSSGLISSLKNDASGVTAKIPCYFECRFIGPNAIGTWPAFWLMTDYMDAFVKTGHEAPSDELDIIEAYGGEGPHEPNAHDLYMVTPHAWNQDAKAKAAADAAYKQVNDPIKMRKYGIPSTWYETFHTYGCKITNSETIYYCDDIEVARHKTLEVSKKSSFFFMVNLATGGGWPVNLSRYDGLADMYVSYVRVYQGND